MSQEGELRRTRKVSLLKVSWLNNRRRTVNELMVEGEPVEGEPLEGEPVEGENPLR